MMSAKTVLTETPACPTPVSALNATAAAAPGDIPLAFQNLLAGAIAPAEPALVGAVPAPSLAPLLVVKNPAPAKAPAATMPAATPKDVSPEALLKLLDDAATRLPAAGEGAADIKTEVEIELPEELLDSD